MRLERLEATQRPEKLKAVFDGETLTVSASLCVQFSLCAGMELDEEAFSALKAAVAKEAARERAVRILTASAVSERELEKRLLQKGMLPSDAADAVAWLKEHRFLDDAATAAQLVDSAVRKGYGRARVKNILYEKGIPKDRWDEALARIPGNGRCHRPLSGCEAARTDGGREDHQKNDRRAAAPRLFLWGDPRRAAAL